MERANFMGAQIRPPCEQEESDMRREFDNLAGELHHLVSTKSIAGVYNPCFAENGSNTQRYDSQVVISPIFFDLLHAF